MKVKALEWIESDPDQSILKHHHVAITPFGKYVISKLMTADGLQWHIDQSFSGRWLPCSSLEKAKTCCQEEFERLVTDCLASVTDLQVNSSPTE